MSKEITTVEVSCRFCKEPTLHDVNSRECTVCGEEAGKRKFNNAHKAALLDKWSGQIKIDDRITYFQIRVLDVLLENRGYLVTGDELRKKVWGRLDKVSEMSLRSAISYVRKWTGLTIAREFHQDNFIVPLPDDG